MVGVPNVKPTILLCESRVIVTGSCVSMPAPEPPIANISSRLGEIRTIVGKL